MCIKHTVTSSDTLYGLARKYNTTVDAIQKANANLIKDVNYIRDGWVLTIPSTSEDSEKVKKQFQRALNDIRNLSSVKKLLEMMGE